MKLVLILSHNCPVGHLRSESQAPGNTQCRQLHSPAAPDARPAQGSLSSLWSSLTLRLRGERRQRRQQRQQRESNHWRESREGWHNEGWPLGRAETGLHRQPGLSQRKYRDGHRVTETPPGARDGELLVTEHRLLGERSRQFWSWNNYGKTFSWHTWHVVSVVSWGQPRLFWNVWVLTSTELIFSTPDGFNEKQKHWRLKLDEKSSVQFSKGWADNY